MSQTNSNDLFHYKYWMIDNPEVAKALNISTLPEHIGDVYMIRKHSEYTPKVKPNISIQGYDYISEKLMARGDVEAD